MCVNVADCSASFLRFTSERGEITEHLRDTNTIIHQNKMPKKTADILMVLLNSILPRRTSQGQGGFTGQWPHIERQRLGATIGRP
jgi:hypothetical protein